MPTGAPNLGLIESQDLDEYTEQVGPWDVRLDKVSAGAFHSRMRFLKIPGITLYDERWEHHVVVRGSPPEGLVVLGTNINPQSSEVRWCGQPLDEQVFACAEGRGDIDFIMPSQGHDAVLLMEPELFEQALGAPARESINAGKHAVFDKTAGAALANTMTALLNRYHRNPALAGNVSQANEIRSQLLIALDNCFSSNQPTDLSSDLRAEALQRALLHIETSQGKTTAWDLARHAGVSQRTLEHIFKQAFGLTPGRYLARSRLNRCYHDLYHANPGEDAVTGIALSWGFSHLGRFSGAYRQQFGELPSQTFGKARTGARRAQLAPL
jgi:AraC-like DNA-binding protein